MLVSVTIGLMGVNVLLVNNYRDMDDDKEAKKYTTVVIFGRKFAAMFYLVSGYFAAYFLSPIWYMLPNWTAVIPLLYLVMHTITWRKLKRREGSALNPLLGATGRNMLIFAVLLAIAMIMNPR